MCFVTEMLAEFVEFGLKPRRTIDEELGVLDLMFVLELQLKHFGGNRRPVGVEADVKELIGF